MPMSSMDGAGECHGFAAASSKEKSNQCARRRGGVSPYTTRMEATLKSPSSHRYADSCGEEHVMWSGFMSDVPPRQRERRDHTPLAEPSGTRCPRRRPRPGAKQSVAACPVTIGPRSVRWSQLAFVVFASSMEFAVPFVVMHHVQYDVGGTRDMRHANYGSS